MKQAKLIGISGTNGSGKDTVGQMLADKHGWLFVSVSDMLREELKRRNLPLERENLRMVSGEWRRQFGLGVLIDKANDVFEKQKYKYKGLAIVSLRNPGEADRVHELGGKVVWVDSGPKIRYDRIYSRSRGDEDNKTYEQFLEEEKAEMERSGDETMLHMSGVKSKADIFLKNNGDNIEDFLQQAENNLSKVIE